MQNTNRKAVRDHRKNRRRKRVYSVEPLPDYKPLDLLTDVQAARVLHTTPGSLRVWRVTGKFPTLRYERRHRSIFYQFSDLLAFIESNKVGVKPANVDAAGVRASA